MPLPFPSDTQQFDKEQRPFLRLEYWPTTFTPLRNDIASAGIRMWLREPTSDGLFDLGTGSAFQLSLAANAQSTFHDATARDVVVDGRIANLIAYWGGGAPGYHGATKSRRVAYHWKAVVRPLSGRDWFSESNSFTACLSCHGNGYFRVVHTPVASGVPADMINTFLDEKSYVDKAVGPFFSDAEVYTTGDILDFYYVQDLTDWGGYYFKMVSGGKPATVRTRRFALREAPVIGCGLMDDGTSTDSAMQKRTTEMLKGGEIGKRDGEATRCSFRVPLANVSTWDGIGWEWVRGVGAVLPPPPDSGLTPGAWTLYQQQNRFFGMTFTAEPNSGFNGGPAMKLTIPPNSGSPTLEFDTMCYCPIEATLGHTYRLSAKVRTSWNVTTDDSRNGNPGIAMHFVEPPLAGVGRTLATAAAHGSWETLTFDQSPVIGVEKVLPMFTVTKGALVGGPYYVWFSNVTLTDLTTSETVTLPLTFGGSSTSGDAGSSAAQSMPDKAGFLRLHDFEDNGSGGVTPVVFDIKRQRLMRIVSGFRRWDDTEEFYRTFTGFVDDFEGAGTGEVTVHCLGLEQRTADQHVKNYPDVISYMAHGFSRLSGTVEPVFPIAAYDNWPQELMIRDMLLRCGIDESRTRAPLLVPQPDGSAIEVRM